MRWSVVCALVLCSCMKLRESHILDARTQKFVDKVEAGTNRVKDAIVDITPENEYYLGRAVATNILARHDYRYLDKSYVRDNKAHGLTLYVNRVGALLAAAALEEPRRGDRPAPQAGFHFLVIDAAEPNAWAAPGGFILVTLGAVRLAENEDQLAAVLAHEVAHVVRGHALGSIKKDRWASMGKDLLNATSAGQKLNKMAETMGAGLDDMLDGMVKGYSRDTELEADAVGAKIMRHAGYDPAAFVAYLRRLAAKHGAAGAAGFASTHPKPEDRIERLEAKLAKADANAAPVTVADARTKRFRSSTSSARH